MLIDEQNSVGRVGVADQGLGRSGFDPSRVVADLERKIRALRKIEGGPDDNFVAPIIRGTLENVLDSMRAGLRDSDGNPKGDNEVPSRSDDSAGPKDIAQPSSPSQ